jgi:hypothetical protein
MREQRLRGNLVPEGRRQRELEADKRIDHHARRLQLPDARDQQHDLVDRQVAAANVCR